MFDDFYRFSKQINDCQRFLSIVQRFSAIFHDFQRFSTIFTNVHRFFAIWDKGPDISANCQHSPQSKTLTKGPPRTSGEKNVRTSVPILARQTSRVSGDLFVHPTRIFPPAVCQFWPKKANPIHGQFIGDNHRSCGTPGFARSCPVLRCHPTPFGGVPSRAGPQEDVRMRHANSLKLSILSPKKGK